MSLIEELLPYDNRQSKVIRALTDELHSHQLFSSLSTIESIRIYMESQVWCVWDFMALVKSVQLGLISSSIYWTPPLDATAGNYIYEVLATEETDINHKGSGHASHFETYQRAMKQAGAELQPITTFIRKLRKGCTYVDAISAVELPLEVRSFVDLTISFALAPLHVAVGALCLTREGIIPGMFAALLNNCPDTRELTVFRWYLNRHIMLDTDRHGPLSARLFRTVVGGDPEKLAEALDAAIQGLNARKALLDSILVRVSPSGDQP